MKYIWRTINNDPDIGCVVPLLYSDNEETLTQLTSVIIPVMCNMHFNIGFGLSREELDKYINVKTTHDSWLETSLGYTGVNIKMSIAIPDTHPFDTIVWNKDSCKWYKDSIQYADLIRLYPDQKKLLRRKRKCTFLVFSNGNVIYSSMDISLMKSCFNEFVSILRSSRSLVQDKIKSV